MANLKQTVVINAVDNTTKGIRSAQNKLNSFDRLVKRVQTSMLGFIGLNIGANIVRGLTQASDAAIELDAKLRLMTNSAEEFNTAQAALVDISLESGSSLNANTLLFTRMNKAIIAGGGSLETTIGLTRTLSQGLRISGASTQESASVVRQFSQAMASGVLRGEEFNAIMENGGRIGLALADGLGVPIGKLREMAKAGELTSQRVTDALLSQSETLQAENAKLPLTIGRAIENINTKWTKLLASMQKGNNGIAKFLNGIAENFDSITTAISFAGKAFLLYYGAKGISALKAYGAAQATNARNALEAHLTEKANKAKEIAGINKEFLARTKSNQALAEKAVASANAALATSKEYIAATKLEVSEAQLNAVRTRGILTSNQSLVAETKLAVIREQNYRATLVGKKAIATSLATTEALLKKQKIAEAALSAAVKEHAVSNSALSASMVKLNALQAKNINLSVAATSAQGKLAAATNSVAVATKRAELANLSLAGRVRLSVKGWLAMARGMGLAKVAIKGFVAVGKGLSSLIFGWGSIIAFVVYEVLDYFGLWETAVFGVKRLFAGLRFELANLFTFGDAYDAALAKFNEESAAAADKFVADREAMKNGHANAEEAKVQAELAAAQKQIQIQSDLKDKTNQLVTARTDHFKAQLKQMEEAEKLRDSSSESAIAKIEFETNLQVEALKARVAATGEGLEAIAALEVEAEASILEIKIANIEEDKARYAEFYKGKLEAADAAKESEIELRIAANEKLRELNAEAVETLRASTATLQSELSGHATNIANLESQLQNGAKSSADFIRSIEGDKRSSYQKTLDAQTESGKAIKKIAEAAALDDVTNYKQKQKLNEDALADLKDVVKEEKSRLKASAKGSAEETLAKASLTEALGTYKTAVVAVAESQKNSIIQEKALSEQKKTSIAENITSIKEYEKVIAELDKNLENERLVKVSVDLDRALEDINKINKAIDALNKTVTVKVVEQRVQAAQSGGTIRRADGGFVPRANKVPGTGSGDKIKALLEPGEFIMRKSAVEKFGESSMYALNRGENIIKRQSGGMIPRFATGGKIDDPFSPEALAAQAKQAEADLAKKKSDIKERNKPKELSSEDKERLKYKKLIADTKQAVRHLKQLGKGIGTIQSSGFSGYQAQLFNQLPAAKRRVAHLKKQFKQGQAEGKIPLNLVAERFAEGGKVAGKGIGDSVKALLTPGEFVMKKSSVNNFGQDFFENLNKGVMPKRFANGGAVTPNGGSSGETVNVNLSLNGKESVGQFPKNDATMQLLDSLKQAGAAGANS